MNSRQIENFFIKNPLGPTILSQCSVRYLLRAESVIFYKSKKTLHLQNLVPSSNSVLPDQFFRNPRFESSLTILSIQKILTHSYTLKFHKISLQTSKIFTKILKISKKKKLRNSRKVLRSTHSPVLFS